LLQLVSKLTQNLREIRFRYLDRNNCHHAKAKAPQDDGTLMEQIADNARADSPAVKKQTRFNSVDPIDLIQIIYDKIKYLYNTFFDEV